MEEVSFEPMTFTQISSGKPTLFGAERSNPPTAAPTSNKLLVQIDQLPQEAIEEGVDLTFKTERVRSDETKVEKQLRYEPEVEAMEFLPIVNERGNIVGRALYLELHRGNKMLHPVAHLHVINSKGETIRRYWWHVAFGETPEKTLRRKMAEALGLSGVKPLLRRQYIRESKTEKELVYVFTVVSEENLPSTPEGKDYIEVFAKD